MIIRRMAICCLLPSMTPIPYRQCYRRRPRNSQTVMLEWRFMTGDGSTTAANLAIRMPKSLVIWKLGYNDTYPRCSPGSILFEELVKREIGARTIDEINLTTDQPWYDNWEMRRRT